jgi:hypothetical protein
MEKWRNDDWQGKIKETQINPPPAPLRPQRISHEVTQARSRSSAVRRRPLTVPALAQPLHLSEIAIHEEKRLGLGLWSDNKFAHMYCSSP